MTTLQSPPPAFADPSLTITIGNSKPRTSFVTPERFNNQKQKSSHRQGQEHQIDSPKEPTSPWSLTPRTSNSKPSPQSTVAESGKKSASKVSHVICKFYKAGNCSAGSACQFSHNLPEVGQGKPICQWFVKGNCRFAHKCALAHILPGQPMSMDRKNKRAAQTAAREAAAPNSAHPNDSHVLSASPPELNFHINQTIPHHSINPHSESIDPNNYGGHDIHSSHAQLQSITLHSHLLNDSDGDHNPHLTDELEFGLPDDFAHTSIQSHSLTPHSISGQRNHLGNFSVSVSSPAQTHFSSDPFGPPHSATRGSRPVSPDQARLPKSIARGSAWARDQSPSPFGFGSPFSAPGSRSVFLPRPGSFGSEDGFPRSAPSVATSPRQHPFMINPNHPDDSMIWNHTDHEDDVTELLPSSLHSLLTPEERHRQRLRKHTHQLFSQSVPAENFVNKPSPVEPLHTPIILQDPPSLSVSALPTLDIRSRSPLDELLSHQRETSTASTIRPLAHTHLSSSYVPPSNLMGGWQTLHQHAELSQHPHTLSPPLISSPRQDSGFSGHAPGSSLPQGLAAGLSRLHFQPPLHTGLTPSCSPSSNGFINGLSTGLGPIGLDGASSPPTSNPHYSSPTSAYSNNQTRPQLNGSDGFSKGLTSNLRAPSALSQRLAALNFTATSPTSGPNAMGSSAIGRSLYTHSSPLSRNVSYGLGAAFHDDEDEGSDPNHDPFFSTHNRPRFRNTDDDDAPFELEI